MSRVWKTLKLVLASVPVLAAWWSAPVAAHVGSPDTWFEGQAGPYPVRVVVRAPGVVPGLAAIDVRVLDGTPQRVTVTPFAWNAGTSGAPPPDVARRVPGDARLYSVNLWLMIAGSYGVHVTVNGDRGEGTAIVPVQAVATQRLPMDAGLGWTLIALALFLYVGLVTAVGAAVRESTVPAGQVPDRGRVARARVVMAMSAILLAVGLFGGRAWWNGVDRSYAEGMYKPFHASAGVVDSAGGSWLRLAIDDPRWRGREWTPLLSDHGKLMHLFLVKEADLNAIAHVHPTARDSVHFEARLPPLPDGRYRVYADIVHESGFAQTLTASIDLRSGGAPAPYIASDADDSWFVGAGMSESDSTESRFMLADGSTLTWERGAAPLVERRDHPLRFRVTARDGSPAALEPYLGMAAHAMVTRPDGTVFAHLHPIGSVSMAAEMALQMRTPADSVAGSLGRRLSREHGISRHAMPAVPGLSGEFSIPYGFPRSGPYRIWVQVKHGGAVRTAAFDVEVEVEVAAAPPPS